MAGRIAFCQTEKARPFPAEPLSLCGGAKRDRTADLYNAIVALSQLSYGPETLRRLGRRRNLAELRGAGIQAETKRRGLTPAS